LTALRLCHEKGIRSLNRSLKAARVLVMGGSGFIGRHLCRTLVNQGAVVRGFSLDNPSFEGIFGGLAEDIDWIQGDFGDETLVGKALQGVEIVFHLACTTIPASSNRDLRQDLASNVLPTLSMLEAARCSGVRKVVFVSSGGTVYGAPDHLPIPEAHEQNPICGYGVHKLAIEKYLYLYWHHFGLDYAVLRVSNPYGIGQVSDRAQGAIGSFLYKALMHLPVEIWGDGSVVRDYIYIDDAIDAFIKVADYKGHSRVFNIGSGEGHSLLDIVNTIEHVLGRKLEVNFGRARAVDVPSNILDISRAVSELGWRPKTDLVAGIQYIYENSLGLRGESR
jgi:UDP-glucose 4-epimerase